MHRRLLRMQPLTQLLGGVAVAAIVATGCGQGTGATASSPTRAPSASAATTQVMGTGMFHDVDGTASGEAQLVVKPDGTYEVVLESFKVGSIAHTNLVLVSNFDVAATADIDKASSSTWVH